MYLYCSATFIASLRINIFGVWTYNSKYFVIDTQPFLILEY